MAGHDSNTRLLLHLNGADAAQATLDATARHAITFVNTAELDTAQKKWGTSSLLLDGNSDGLTIPDSSDWDLCANDTDDWTIDFQVKHSDHAGQEYYLNHHEGDDDRWWLMHEHGAGLTFSMNSTGNKILLIGGEITDTNWHHVALIKVDDDYGIYLDGTQTAHSIGESDNDTFTGLLYIGSGGAYFDGWMDEIRFQFGNYFNATPNATPDDTITVPTEAYSQIIPKGGMAIGHGPHIYKFKKKSYLWVPDRIWWQSSTTSETK